MLRSAFAFLLVSIATLASACGCPAIAPTESGQLIESSSTGELDPNADHDDQTPIVGATVRLYEDDELLSEDVTDENGYYGVGFGNACEERGDLEVHYQAEGYEELRLEWLSGSRLIGLAPTATEARHAHGLR